MTKSSPATKPKEPRKRPDGAHRSWDLREAQVSALRRVSELAARVVPPVQLPLFDRIPPAERMVNTNFDRVQRLLDRQREFTLELIDAMEPLRSKLAARKRKGAHRKGRPRAAREA